MRAFIIAFVAACCVGALVPSAFADGGTLTGFAFVDSSVTGMGSQGKLPAGTKIYPPGSKITGTDGCPTNRYHTDGMIVAVIDYQGRPTAASITDYRTSCAGRKLPARALLHRPEQRAHAAVSRPNFRKRRLRRPLQLQLQHGASKNASAKFALDRTCR